MEHDDLTSRLVAALEALMPFLEDLTDMGPSGSGWKSSDFESAIAEAHAAIAEANS